MILIIIVIKLCIIYYTLKDQGGVDYFCENTAPILTIFTTFADNCSSRCRT